MIYVIRPLKNLIQTGAAYDLCMICLICKRIRNPTSWRQSRQTKSVCVCVCSGMLEQQLLVIDPSSRLFVNDTHGAFSEVVNNQQSKPHTAKQRRRPRKNSLSVSFFPVVSNLFVSVQLCSFKWYRSFPRCHRCLAVVKPALAQLGTAGREPDQCAGPDNGALGRAEPRLARLPVLSF